MELKVWVEGIQRIICGVTMATSTSDVVYALAHATGKTGRFTLIERWRNSERLLAPNEQPLKVLLKWGEHSNDVQFILQWAPLDSGSGAQGGPTSKHQQQQQQQQQQQLLDSSQTESSHLFAKNSTNFTSLNSSSSNNSSSNSPSLNPGSGVSGKLQDNNTSSSNNKSTPFSSNVANLPSPSEDKIGSPNMMTTTTTKKKESIQSVGVVRGVQQRGGAVGNGSGNSGSDSLVNSLSSTTSTNSSSCNNPSSIDNNTMMMNHTNNSSASGKVISMNSVNNDTNSMNNKILSAGGIGLESGNNTSGGSSSGSFMELDRSQGKKELNPSCPPPYREPPSHWSKGLAHSPSGGINTKGLPPYREPPAPNLNQQRLSSSSTSNNNNNNVSSSNSNNNGSGSPVVHLNQQQQQQLQHHQQQKLINGDIITSSQNQNGTLPISPAPNISTNTTNVTTTTNTSPNSQYHELVRLINLQREKLTSQHAEMTQFDAEIMFWEGRAREQQRNLEFITKEISRLELVSAQQESQVLSLIHLEDESELVKNQSDQLKTEIEALRTEFTNCEKEINLCKNKMGMLQSELHMQHVAMQQRQDEWRQREANTVAEIERLKKELEIARRETDAVQDMSGNLDLEVSTIESDLADKKKQMERLINAMKEANLQSLTIQPPDELVDGGSHHRSGSTRRMIGSPRQLENAVPTKSNPAGIWV